MRTRQQAIKLVSMLSAIIMAIPTLTFAKNINLYATPAKSATVVGKIDDGAKMVPIISTPQGDWMKIGDPENGNVGWINLSDVKQQAAST